MVQSLGHLPPNEPQTPSGEFVDPGFEYDARARSVEAWESGAAAIGESGRRRTDFLTVKLMLDSAGCTTSSESAALIRSPVLPVLRGDQPIGIVPQLP